MVMRQEREIIQVSVSGAERKQVEYNPDMVLRALRGPAWERSCSYVVSRTS